MLVTMYQTTTIAAMISMADILLMIASCLMVRLIGRGCVVAVVFEGSRYAMREIEYEKRSRDRVGELFCVGWLVSRAVPSIFRMVSILVHVACQFN